MAAPRSFEWLVGDEVYKGDAVRQAFREVWTLLDAITEGTGIDAPGESITGGGMTHPQVMSRVSLKF